MEGGPDEDTDPRDAAGERAEQRVRVKPDGAKPSEAALRVAFGLAPDGSVPSGDPESTLVPFARRALARQRQQMLATMVMDDGDARHAADRDRERTTQRVDAIPHRHAQRGASRRRQPLRSEEPARGEGQIRRRPVGGSTRK